MEDARQSKNRRKVMGRITNKSGVSVKSIAHIVDKLSSAIAGAGNFANDGGATIGAQTPVSPRH
jgi:hypothetical protein